MKRRPAVALLIETSNAYARGLLAGVISYIREHESWSVFLPEQERGARPPAWLERWKGDGIIARIETEEIAEAVCKTGLPVVDVSAARRVLDVPWVETDDSAIARLAAEHLMERGFRNLAFCGEPDFNWSKWRCESFQLIVQQRGCEFFNFTSETRYSPTYNWDREKQRITDWLDQLPKPVGIMAAYDIKAQQLLDICREMNISVPEEVAVIGVDNDELLCNLSTPPLSSVIPDTHRTGYEAARLLDRLMAGEKVPGEAHLIEPMGVAARQSSDVLAIDDRDIAAAVRFIREHACDGINVKDVLRVVPLSRRVLESRFRRIMGYTPHEAIVKHRLNRVRQLLRETELPLAAIAERAGFDHVEYLSVTFKRHFGVPPGRFRQQTCPSSNGGRSLTIQ